MPPVVLLRKGDWEAPGEMEAIQAQFPCFQFRSQVPSGSLVIPRYSALPFYRELDLEMQAMGSRLIHSTQQHTFIADIRQYAPVLAGLTPPVYENWGNLPEGAYVLKGVTNSKKHEWSKRMFAPSVKDISRIAMSLLDDQMIASQGIVVRPFVPLKTYDVGINDMPVTNEWRFFVLDGNIVAAGYYWASFPEYQWEHLIATAPAHEDDTGWYVHGDTVTSHGATEAEARQGLRSELQASPEDLFAPPPSDATAMVKQVVPLIDPYARFYVVDVAETATGEWIVIELNDGCMSGLPLFSVEDFYANLKATLAA